MQPPKKELTEVDGDTVEEEIVVSCPIDYGDEVLEVSVESLSRYVGLVVVKIVHYIP